MSDSFADLWNSSAPQKKPQTLSSLAQQQQQRRPQQAGSDLFTLLSPISSTSTPVSNAARSSPSLRSLTPSSTSIPPPQQQRQQQSPAHNPTNDAFSDLFSSSSSSSNQNLTIAQRTALADKQRKEALLAHHKQREKEKSAWAGLDSFGTGGGFTGLTPTNTSKSVSQSKPAKTALTDDDDDDWGLEDFGKSSRTTTTKSPVASSQDKPVLQSTGDAWDFDNFGSSQAPSASKYNNNNKSGGGEGSLWVLDDFSSPSPSAQPSQAQRKTAESHADSPSNDFDFGNREDELLNDHDGDVDGGADGQEDDFMSVFNKPPQPEPRQQPQLTSSPATSSPAPTSTTRSASPPPHILGQVVEMGFSIPKAKAALAANNNDVQAAIDQLLASEGGYTGGSGRGSPVTNAPRRDTGSGNDSPAPTQAPRRRDREREPQQQHQRRGDTSSPVSSSMGGSNDIQAQAEQLFAQASEIGRGVFTKASTFWKEKKEQVQKAYDEHRASSAASGVSGSGGRSGRPKWMQQQNQGEDGDRDFEPPKKGGFRDDEGGERQRAREREAAAAATPPPPVEEPKVDLFAPSSSTPSQTQTLESDLFQSSTPSRSSQTRNQPPSTRRPRPPPKFQRNTTPIPSTIASVKLEANATFKLGQFGNAEAQYTRAIDSLRSSASGDNNNLYFVLLLNNRANARMKTGDINGAVKDCEAVIELITTNQLSTSSNDFDSFGNSSSTKEEETVDLSEGLIKAIKRRAEAYEGMEKWNKAKKDWEWLRSVGWVRESVRGEAGRGVGRCVRMVGGSGEATATKSRPKPSTRPTPSTSTTTDAKPSEALQALRTSTAQAEAEDQAKHELKDSIDAKLSAWKSGKETNIRALLASLDTILWEELVNSGSAVKVGMHELVTPAQVKVKYMKAVAKVHPDKLNTTNSTLEQRMIAQGVFGALTDAWNAFKQ
ncbi:UBA domain-containing protein 7 [Leucoagaricus sp. SymC.cos]|nr:UBA domain-containing protein 7 [Leucoagaricus sp. SymC.cos]